MSRIEGLRTTVARWALGLLLLCGIALAVLAPRGAGAVLNPPPGGPILVVTSSTSTFGDYYAEILRNEGLNSFAVADIDSVSAVTLASYDVVVLAKATLTPTQVSMFTTWVNGGGNLIAMAPDAQLAPLLGLTATGTTLAEGYLLINTAASPGAGLVNQTIQYHGSADRYTLSGATSVATLYSNATTATANPAVTRHNVGSGTASAFTYDLASSVVYTRQGNPAWAAQERDGSVPIRANDKFFGNAAADPQPDWIDLTKVAIPQADEQQRLLANLILHVNQTKKPLPRFWYFPYGKKAVVIMAGDDHGSGGTAGRFDQLSAASPVGCSLADWECLRGTSYMYADNPLTDAQASAYTAAGFEVGLHITTGCNNFTATSLQTDYASQLAAWQAKYASVTAPSTQRHHCVVWSDWSTAAQTQLANGMRLDTTYYFWPPGWVGNVPGLFTGSAMPMRFSALNGALIDVYQATTQMTDESGQSYPATIDTLLDRALGAEGYYGVYTVAAHTDTAVTTESTTVIASAKARSVPVVSSRQMLTWLDGRNASSFGGFTWNGATLAFTISAGPATNGIQAMLPLRSGTAILTAITRGGSAVSFSVQSIKGIDYAFFSGIGGNYAATYGTDTTAPTVTGTTPASGTTGVAVTAAVTATFSEAMNAATITASTFELRNAANVLVPATVTWDVATRTARLAPSAPLSNSSTYTATVRGGPGSPRAEDLSGNPATGLSWSFTTAAASPGSNCPCSGWPATSTPTNPSVSDTSAVELGVRFRTDIDGFITGVRFYKGTANTGTHVGNLWTSSGQLLATATFTGETASGWQQVTFSNPVAVTANTVYVASYFAPNGRYAADGGFFSAAGVDNGPVHLLSNAAAGGNGVYQYGSSSSYPALTYNASNYWVDVVFTTVVGPDTTPPTVTGTTPASGATGVSIATTVRAVFSEAIDPATVSGSTFELRNAANAVVAATVSYDAASRTATLTPSSALASSSTYTATVRGGASDPRIKDLVGNALAVSLSWSFATSSQSSGCPCSGFATPAVPGNPSVNDPNPIELGVKFRTDVGGYITGVRFYKGSTNTGTHIGNLWTSGGQLLASATFVNETASGWQQVTFGAPVPIAANTVYIASYFAPNGNYSGDNSYFANAGVDNGLVHLLQNGVSGGNGVYVYGPNSSFPTQTFGASNYWVDLVFNTVAPPDTVPPAVTSTTPTAAATNVVITSPMRAVFSEPLDPASVSSATFELRSSTNAVVSATVSYDVATRTATLQPTSSLALASTYTATLRGGSTDPRIKDLAGNALAANVTWSFTTEATSACAAPANSIVAENCLAGNPSSEWDVVGSGDSTIQGYATQISVNRGSTVSFKVATNATSYRFDIYRIGYYGGAGARKVATVVPSATLPQNQPACLNDAVTGLVDCGNWGISGSWAIPATAVSGVYLAKVVRPDTGGASHIVFIVRNDASTSDLLFKTSDTTWQAYNDYGGNSLYTGSPAGRAYKVSYNRPFATRGNQYSRAYFFGGEYPMVRWLEANGYDLSYVAGVDVERSPTLIGNHRALLSVGHDEYWSAGQRSSVEAARDSGVHLAFFSGNEVFWKTRWESSIDGSVTAYRTLVSYKETHANAKIDPTATWTGTWRDPRFSPPADGGRPENALTGTIFTVNCCSEAGIQVPAEYGNLRFWRNTSIASLPAGQVAALPAGTLGYEWDEDLDNGARPAGLFRMSSTTVSGVSYLQDFGSTYASGTANHSLTLYKSPSGARVFGAGTIRWSWGLDGNHDFDGATPNASTTPDVRMRQATVNLLADMSAQPGSLQSGLVAATASIDGVAPSTAITSPTAGSSVAVNSTVTISGTASDAGGGVVAGVEVSLDGGTTWRRANGRSTWSYAWTPTAAGAVTIRSRAVDDSGNLQSTVTSVSVTVGGTGDTTPPTVTATTPVGGATGVASTANVTATFSEAMDAATITTATVELRDSTNAVLAATVTYNATTRIATLDPTATLAVGATYTATVRGGATDPRVKDTAGNALSTTLSWTFTTGGDVTPPAITARSPSAAATGVAQSSNVTVTFNEAMDATTIGTSTIELRDAGGALVAAAVTYDAATRVATLNPTPTLAVQAVYSVTVRGGTTDPRVKDLAGNALASDSTWSFTTGGDGTPPTITARSPAAGATGVSRTANITVTFSEAMDSTTIDAITIELRDPSNALVSAVVSYNSTTRVATLNPTPTLFALTTYTARVRGGAADPRVKDSAGNALAGDSTWTFTTVADTTAPTISSRSPASGATNVSRTANVLVTFSEDMNPATIDTSTIELRNPSGTLITSIVTYDTATRRATLNPSITLSALTVYAVTVRGGTTDPRVKDQAGNALAGNSTWQFMTR